MAECAYCEKFVQSPVTLPCLNIICEGHLKENYNQLKTSFKCLVCFCDHEIPEEGFQIISNLNRMVENLDHLPKTEKQLYKSLDRSFEKLSQNEANLKEKKVYLELYAFDHFKEIQFQADLEREELKQKIDLEFDALIERLKKMENLVYDSIKSLTVNNYSNIIHEIKQQLSNEKRSASINYTTIDDLILKIENENNKINFNLAEFEKIKHLTDSVYFEPNLISNTKKPILGSIQMGSTLSLEEKYAPLITADSKNINIWDLETYECFKQIKHEYLEKSRINCLIKLNNYVITASYDGIVKYWDLKIGLCIKNKTVNYGIKSSLNFFNKYLIFGFNSGRIRFYDPETFNCLRQLDAHKTNCHVNHLISYEEDKFISCSNDGHIKCWSINSPNNLDFKLTNKQSMNCLILFKNQLISGSFNGVIFLWCLERKAFIDSIKAHRVQICSFEILKDKNELLSADRSGIVKIWNLNNFNILNVYQDHTSRILSAKFINDRQFITCSLDSTIKIWNTDTNECTKSIKSSNSSCSLFF